MKPSLVLLPTFLFAVRALADVPPACLLSAVNTQDNPTDFSSLCGDEATDVQKAINSLCTSTNKSAAQSAFIATCSSAGSSVGTYCSSSYYPAPPPSLRFASLLLSSLTLIDHLANSGPAKSSTLHRNVCRHNHYPFRFIRLHDRRRRQHNRHIRRD